jgi:hypothetical protein
MTSAVSGRGSTRRWRKLRVLILERDGYLCVYCGGPATTVDHVVPRASFKGEGGTPSIVDLPSNLVASCRACNLAKGSKHPVFSDRRASGQAAGVQAAVNRKNRGPRPLGPVAGRARRNQILRGIGICTPLEILAGYDVVDGVRPSPAVGAEVAVTGEDRGSDLPPATGTTPSTQRRGHGEVSNPNTTRVRMVSQSTVAAALMVAALYAGELVGGWVEGIK